jgi:translation initiation factor 5B
MLVFDIKVLADAQKYAEENEIKIFTANIIYHLTDFFFKYVEECRVERKLKEGKEAVFPCVLKQVACFRKSDPIVLGVDVEAGVLKIGTPVVVYNEKGVFLSLFRNTKKKNRSK